MRSIRLFSAVLFLASTAQASTITYVASLSAANESPTNASTATGFASFTVDTVANTIMVNVTFSGLTTPDTAAHIHCCVPPGGNTGVATFAPVLPGFPMGVTSGSFTNQLFSLLDPGFYLSSYVTANGGTPASAEAALLAGLAAGQAYFNIHTMQNTSGEIRGFLVATPEPGTFILAGLALAGLALSRRRARARI